MDVHKPNSVRSWRAFLGEVGIIVLGVLLALAAEQTVQWLEWQQKVAAATESMRLELTDDDGPQFYARAAQSGCVQQALDRIREGAEGGADRQTMLHLISGYQTSFWTWDSLAFDAALSSDVSVHMKPRELQRWVLAYSTMPAVNAANAKEFNDGAELAALSRTGGALEPEERNRIIRAVEVLRRDALTIDAVVRVALPQVYATGVRVAPEMKSKLLGQIRRNYGTACMIVPAEPRVEPVQS